MGLEHILVFCTTLQINVTTCLVQKYHIYKKILYNNSSKVCLKCFKICAITDQEMLHNHSVRCAGAGGWCWSGMREKYCWLAGGWRLEAGAGAM